MPRIIILLPLDEDVGLTTISLSMIYFFNKNILRKNSSKSILYFSCIKNLLDDTSLIIRKYFSKIVYVSEEIDFSKVSINTTEYFDLLNKIKDKYCDKKFSYELILIEGIKNNYNLNSVKINFDIAKKLSAEVILLATLEKNSLAHIKEKEKNIKTFLEQKKYENFLGIIFNKIGSPLKKEKFDFIKNLTILENIKSVKKEKNILTEVFKKNFFSILAYIPWNKKIIRVYVREIADFLTIQNINLIENKNNIIESIIIFDESDLNILDKNCLIIVSYSRLKFFISMFNLNINSNKIRCIILTGALKSKKYITSICKTLIKKSVIILFTEKNTLDLLSILYNFNFNINIKDKIHITRIQKYISSFFSHSVLMKFKKIYKSNKICSSKEFCYNLKLLSKKRNKRIILPESYEIRILKAAAICYKNNIAQCVLLGNAKKIRHIANNYGINLNDNIEIIDPSLIREKYVSRLLEIRKEKGIDKFSAKKQLEDDIVLATLLLESNRVDGLVSGSINTTSNTIRPALQIIKSNSSNLIVSSIFFMLLPDQVLIYGDCAINIDPTAEELAEIAIQSAESSKIFGIEPRIAMLSYSTGSSGSGYKVEKVKRATSIVKYKRPDLIIDGPIQYDAAVSKSVSKVKAPYSEIAGSANVFVFPDLNSGNIAYKAVQHSAKIVSIGPILQGLKKPVNDLSRGASVEDIVYSIALTSIQAE